MRRPLAVVLACAVLGLAPPTTAQEGPPPTPVPPDGSPSPYPQSLQTPEPSTRPPRLSAAAALLFDLHDGRVLWERRGGERRPIASLTKIMTVLFALESADLDETVTASERAAAESGSELGLAPGEEIALEDLLYALILQSSNDGAVALAEHLGGTVERFVRRMNQGARRLGLRDSRFESPHGLDDGGHSTARDVARITTAAFRHPAFVRIARTRLHVIPAPEGPPRRIQSRNALLWLYRGAIGVKTGFTSAAGFCLVAAAERGDRRFGAVILGSPDEAFSDAAAVLDHGFLTWSRRTVVAEGEGLAPVTVGGVPVRVAAGATIEGLVRRGDRPVVRHRADPGLRPPVTAGQTVGEVVAVVRGGSLGTAPLVAAEDVPARTAEPEAPPPWWDDVRDSIATAASRLLASLF